MASKTDLIEQILDERYVCETLPYGALQAIGREVGVTREYVRQVVARRHQREGRPTPRVRRFCGSCGAEMKP